MYDRFVKQQNFFKCIFLNLRLRVYKKIQYYTYYNGERAIFFFFFLTATVKKKKLNGRARRKSAGNSERKDFFGEEGVDERERPNGCERVREDGVGLWA